MAVLRLVFRRAAEMLDEALVTSTRATEASITRQAARVLRSRAIIFGSGVWFPAGVIVHLSPVEHARLAPLFVRARAAVAAKVATRLRTPEGGLPEIRVVFDLDPELSSGFAVSTFDEMDSPARLTLVKPPAARREVVANYPVLELCNRTVRVDPAGVELGREVAGPGRISDPTCSARHAFVTLAPEGLRLTDVGSTNGTWLNGARVSEALLHHGDSFRLGATTVWVKWEAERPTARVVDGLQQEDRTASPDDLIREWHRLVCAVPNGEDRLQWLTSATGMRFRVLDRVRRLRNAAGSDGAVDDDDLRWALRVLADARIRLEAATKEASA